MIVCKCDLCGEIKECVQKEIDLKEYDVCQECWDALEVKLRGKGRAGKSKGIVLLPHPGEKEEQERKLMPGGPPTIWSASGRPN